MIARWIAGVGLVLGLSVSPARSSYTSATPPAASLAGGEGRQPVASTAHAGTFVRTLVAYKGRLWVGTFNDGLLVVDAWPSPEGLEHARSVSTPFRMVNDALEVQGALYVAANEGLFVTSDGSTFERVRQVGARGVTAVAYDGRSVYATTTSALWRVRLGKGGPPNAVWWKPAGSRSLQGVVTEHDRVWMASEDRGAILFDGKKFTAYDRLAGLPTSWVVAIAGDGRGGVFGATLRDGAFHVDTSGHWQAMQGLPSAWTLSIARSDREVCVGTQEGAACYESPRASDEASWSAPLRIDGLPDPRAHSFLAERGSLLVGTEAGMAVVAHPPRFEP